MGGFLKTRHSLHRLARITVYFAVLVSPWLFGSAEPWAYYLVCVPALAGLGFLLFSVVCYPDTEIRAPLLSLSLLALLLFMAFQSMPLPPMLVKALNPLSGEAHIAVEKARLSRSGWTPPLRDARETSDSHARQGAFQGDHGFLDGGATESIRPSVSASSAATRRSMFLFASYLAVFFVTVNTCRHWHHLRQVAGFMIGSSFLMAVVAVSHRLSGSRLLLWFHKARYGGTMFGPFTNRNHYAAYMSLCFGVTLGLILATGVLLRGKASGGWQEKFRWASSKKVNLLGLMLFAAAFIAGSVAFSCSRAGMVSLVMATGLVWGFVGLRQERGTKARIMMSVSLLAIGLLLWFGWQPVLRRFESLWAAIADPVANTRTLATLDTIRVFAACPMFGCGFGSFQYVFPMFMREELQFGLWVHAHNDWAQLLAEGGLIGASLVVVCVFLFCRAIVIRLPEARRSARAFAEGLAVGLVAIALHSLADYSLHKPAIAMQMCAVAGMAIAVLHLPKHGESGVTNGTGLENGSEKPRHGKFSSLKSVTERVFSIVGVTVVVIGLVQGIVGLRRSCALARFDYSRRQWLVERAKPDGKEWTVEAGLEDAVLVKSLGAPTPDELREIASQCFRWALDDRLSAGNRIASAEESLSSAVLLVRSAPTDYLSWLWLARVQGLTGQWDEADEFLDRARVLKPHGEKVALFENDR